MKVCHIGCGWNPYPGGNAIRAVNIIRSLYFHLNVQNIVVTDTPSSTGEYTFEILAEAVIYRVKGFWKMVYISIFALMTDDIDVIHTHNIRMFLALALFKIWKPIVLEIHSLPQVSGLKRIGMILALRYASRIIVLSDACKTYLTSHYQTPMGKITVIRNGIDIDKFASQNDSIRKSQDLCNVGYVGTIHHWQGVFDFVEAIPHVIMYSINVQFHMIGQGPDFEAVKRRSEELGMRKHIVFHGSVPFTSVPEILRVLDIVVIPRPSTLATETTVPLKVFEFMAAGKAIIASDVGGLLEVLHPGQDCLMYRSGSVIDLAKAIEKLAVNRELIESLGKNAIENVKSQPTWVMVADRLKNLYCEQIRQ